MDMKKFFYRVGEGDTVFSLSQKFSVPVGIIISLNNLTKEIECGDMLYIEKDCGQTVYSVGLYETAFSIGQKFGISPSVLLKKNRLPYFFYGLTIFL